jgi:hypothetical protein
MMELESVCPPVRRHNTVRIILHGSESNLQPPRDGTVYIKSLGVLYDPRSKQ